LCRGRPRKAAASQTDQTPAARPEKEAQAWKAVTSWADDEGVPSALDILNSPAPE